MNQFLAQIFVVIHQIPQGKVSTYGDIAKMAGYPGYARHVGKALSNLPEGSTLPWFRVINSAGKISLTGENFNRQKVRLVKDGVVVSETGRVNLRQFKWQL
ncbi:MGMT family protein [Vibrio sp. MA40-2]|uniref:MGMT family protein n=1 Tax=Vibrio sp. MA40-2 TaxID=3391828 RepID=UPI0039A57AC7